MLWQQVINGLAQGSIYALLAIGFSLISGIMRMITFSHGEVFMIGAYAGLLAVAMLGQNILFGFIVAMLVSLILGILTERLAFKPFRGGSPLTPALITIGLSIMLQDAILLIAGSDTKPFPVEMGDFKVALGSTTLSGIEIAVFVSAVVFVALLQVFIYKTRWGLALRATAQNHDAASLMGVKPELIIMLTFAVASALAGAAGLLTGIYYDAFYPRMGVVISLKALSAATLGGIGSVTGAIIGGLLLGLIENIAVAFVSTSYRDIIAFVILIAVLLVRPAGLAGRMEEEKA